MLAGAAHELGLRRTRPEVWNLSALRSVWMSRSGAIVRTLSKENSDGHRH